MANPLAQRVSTTSVTNHDSHQSIADRLAHARNAIESAANIEDIKSIRDKAEIVRQYVKRASIGLEMQNFAAEVKLRAERKAGSLLTNLKLRGGDRRSNSYAASLKLADLGISRDQSARWQTEATVPEEDFDQFIESAKHARTEISSAKLLRLARDLKRPAQDGTPAPTQDPSIVESQPKQSRSPLQPQLQSFEVLLSELKGHQMTLTNLVAPICESTEHSLTSLEKRAISLYLHELGSGMSELESIFRKIFGPKSV